MPVNSQIQGLLDLIASKNLPPHYLLAPPEARVAMEKARAVFRGPEVPLARIEPLSIPGAAGAIPARLYASSAARELPMLVYFHGGGWVIGSLDTHDDLCRRLARESGSLVISVDYRMAPEHKFPASVDDAFAATKWIAAHAKPLGGDPQRLAVGGDSAGGNLAAVVALLARDAMLAGQGGPALRFQLLIYPVVGKDFTLPSMRAYGDGLLLTATGMHWFWNHYLSLPAQARDLRACPILAPSLKGLPRAHIVLAEYDVLRDEGEEYGRLLNQAGVPVEVVCYDGMIHGFAAMTVVERAVEIVKAMGQALRKGLA
jgi:acetyl esterase